MSTSATGKLIHFVARVLRVGLRSRARWFARRHGLQLNKIGTPYGGWVVVDGILNDRSTCLCVGCGEDISFDVEIARRHGSLMVLYDPTPRAIAHVEDVLAAAKEGRRVAINNSPTQVYDIDSQVSERIQFHPRAVSSVNGLLRLYMPTRSDFVSCSMLAAGMSEDFIDVESVTVDEAIRLSGVAPESLDLIKLDIEGAEYEVIARLLEQRMLPKLICLELDGLSDRIDGLPQKWRAVQLIWALRRKYFLVALDDLNATFLRRDMLVARSSKSGLAGATA